MFMALFILYGFDTAGTFGEETIDASRQAPRGVLSSVLISGSSGAIFLLAVILAIPDVPARSPRAWPVASRSRHHHGQPRPRTSSAGITVGELYLLVILVSVFVCTLAIQGAATRMMFSMGRDRHLPLGARLGPRQLDVQDAGQRGHRGRRPRGAADPRDRARSAAFSLSIAATGLIYLSYFLCNLGVLAARERGWPHEPAWFNLGRWGTLVNILALVYGGADDHQHRPLGRTRTVR